MSLRPPTAQMQRLLLLLAVLTMAVGVFTLPASAQETGGPEPIPLHIESVDSSGHPAVEFVVSVPRGLVGLELPVAAFSIREDGVARAVAVEKLPADDIEVVLVLDLSGSMRGEPLREAQAAVTAFTQQIPPGVEVAVVGFGDTVTVVADFTTDLEAIVAAVDDLAAGGETALYDGLVEAAALFPASAAARRSMVVLSDGGDTVSTATLEEAIIATLDAGASFYVVELESPESDHAALTRLTGAASGRLVAAGDPEALGGIFDEIAAELVNQYRLTIESGAFGSTDVVVTVSAAGVVAEASRRLPYPAPPVPPSTTPTTVAAAPATTAAPVPTVPEPRPGALADPGVLERPWALAAGAGMVFAGLAALFVLSFENRRRKRRYQATGAAAKETRIGDLANRASLFAERALKSKGRHSGISATLEQAGILLRPGEFVVLALSGGIIGLAVGHLVSGPLLGVGLAIAVVGAFRLVVSVKANRRQAAFAAQLGDTLQLISGGIRAGYGLLQAIDAVAAEAISPTAEELRRLIAETNIGRDLSDALKAMARRVRSEDFEWVVEAIEIHREVGGDLAEILESVAATIRDRNQIRRRIRSLSAEGRMSAVILLGLPFAVGAAVAVTNPGYLAELTGSGVGQGMIVVGLVLMVVGTTWMRRIVKLKY